MKDELNPDGSVKTPATAKDVKANNAKSRLGCTVSPKYSLQFAASVSWQKVDKDGNNIEEGDDITQGNSNVDPNSSEPNGEEPNTGGDTPGGNTGGGDTPGGNGGNGGGGNNGGDDPFAG